MAENMLAVRGGQMLGTLGTQFARSRDVLVALFIVGTLVIMVAPLPTMIMDLLLGLNLTFSLVLLLTTIYVKKPNDLSTFPSMLLVATLYRLSLNIATTRLILGNAAKSGDEGGELAAGKLVSIFAGFVSGASADASVGSLVIGLVIFFILVIIQFVVITKGATRIAEVAARFTLDAMPGQQMAIDADLNAGLIDDKEAKRRREDLRQLTDFYGAMDGASKFVRGDAVAGIIITLVNIVAGLIIGVLIYGMEPATAGRVFTKLTIGDGLISQIPALLVSIASGLLITRGSSKAEFGTEVLDQLFSQRRSMAISSVLLGGLGLTGLVGLTSFPKVLLLIGGACGAAWYNMVKATAEAKTEAKDKAERKGKEEAAAPKPAEKIEASLRVDAMEMEVGYGLVPLVDVSQSRAGAGSGGGGLLGRIQMIRQQMAHELGIIVPAIRIRDNIQLDANEYAIKIHGAPVARGKAEPDKYLAMDSGMAREKIEGIQTTEPAFGLPAVWIREGNREHAERAGYTVVDAETVVATHLTEVIKTRAHELLTREEVRKLLDSVREYAPNLVQEVVPDLLNIADLQKVLQNLLRERVSVRNLPAILETLGDVARRTKDTEVLTEYARNALSRWMCNEYSEKGRLYVVTLDPKLEDAIQAHMEQTEGGSFLSLRPAAQKRLVEAVAQQVQKQLQAGHSALLLTGPKIRSQVRRLTEAQLPVLVVMSYNEILPDYAVESIGMVSVDLGTGA